MQTEFDIYLASQSPRRREILSQLGIRYEVIKADIDETIRANESAKEYVTRLAEEKALAGWKQKSGTGKAVLGADTSVILDDEILGKPRNHEDAVEMLSRLSGRMHEVYTGIAIAKSSESDFPEILSEVSISQVTFCQLSASTIESYWLSGEPVGKAGAYAIQGRAAAFVMHLSGSYTGVMGLPAFETVKLIQQAGIRLNTLIVS